MPRFVATVVLTIERVYEGIEIDAFSPEQAEDLARGLDLGKLQPMFEDVVDTHVEADLA